MRKKRGESETKERRVYTKEFKAEVVALAGKHEKPVRHLALDLGINENICTGGYSRHEKWQEPDCRPFPDTGGLGTRN
jgi:transposase-like protein